MYLYAFIDTFNKIVQNSDSHNIMLVFSGYVIERSDADDDLWTTLPDVVTGTKHTVGHLKNGKKYKFRVRAENMYGLSDPIELDKPVLAKNPYG